MPRAESSLPTTRISVDEYERMVHTGELSEDDRLELIRGEIVPKMTTYPSHSGCVKWLIRFFARFISPRADASVQDPVHLADSEPEPDFAILRPRADLYRNAHPRAEDILLIIEVADSSLETDRTIKKEIYAENGIGEYWIVNLRDQTLEVYREPTPDGNYGVAFTLSGDQIAEILALPGVTLRVEDLF
jgi:Uma2 family endonuclease